MPPPHPFVQKHPDPSVCPECARHRAIVAALVEANRYLDGNKGLTEEWCREFDREIAKFKKHREACNEHHHHYR